MNTNGPLFLLPFFCLSWLPRGHSCSPLRYACLEIFTIPWIMFRRQGEPRLSIPLLDHNCLSHCSLWSSAGPLDYMLSLHMPCWLHRHVSSSAVPSSPPFSILFEQMISFFELSPDLVKRKKEKNNNPGGWGQADSFLLLVSALMSCARAAHFVSSAEILLRRCQKSIWCAILYIFLLIKPITHQPWQDHW